MSRMKTAVSFSGSAIRVTIETMAWSCFSSLSKRLQLLRYTWTYHCKLGLCSHTTLLFVDLRGLVLKLWPSVFKMGPGCITFVGRRHMYSLV